LHADRSFGARSSAQYIVFGYSEYELFEVDGRAITAALAEYKYYYYYRQYEYGRIRTWGSRKYGTRV
jgi:hypothetical protein